MVLPAAGFRCDFWRTVRGLYARLSLETGAALRTKVLVEHKTWKRGTVKSSWASGGGWREGEARLMGVAESSGIRRLLGN